MDTVATAEPALLPLGIHFGLPFQRYLDDPGLGSHDIALLARNPSSWWWNSRHNPDRPPPPVKKKKHFSIGTAVHKLLLEGREAFDREYVSAPLHAQGLTPYQKGAATRAFNSSIAGSDVIPLTGEDYERIVLYAGAIRRNPFIANVFENGYSEVSVFWEREGIRLRGRFDYLKMIKRPGFMLAANGDLKTVENIYLDEFRRVCRQAIAKYGYDAQAAHYIDGLSRMPQMVRDGMVYGTDVVRVSDAWLSRFRAPDIRQAWQWIFVQKNDMPVIASYTMTPGFNGSPGSPIFEEGASKVNLGIQRYIDCVEKFGFDMPWDFSAAEPPEELVPEEMPRWYGGH